MFSHINLAQNNEKFKNKIKLPNYDFKSNPFLLKNCQLGGNFKNHFKQNMEKNCPINSTPPNHNQIIYISYLIGSFFCGYFTHAYLTKK